MQAEPPPPSFSSPHERLFEACRQWRRAVIVPLFDSAALALSSGSAGPRRPWGPQPPQLQMWADPPYHHPHSPTPHPSLFLLTSILPHQHMLEVLGSSRLPAFLPLHAGFTFIHILLIVSILGSILTKSSLQICKREIPVSRMCTHTYTHAYLHGSSFGGCIGVIKA